jgi:hypothetical protein
MGLVWALSSAAIFVIAVVVAKEYRLSNPRGELQASSPLPPLPKPRRRHAGKLAARHLAPYP